MIPEDAFCPMDDIPVNVSPTTVVETKAAIQSMKAGWAPGLDEISVEMLKNCDDLIVKQFTAMLNRSWDTMTAERDWRKGVIVKLQKKGDLADCKWRRISLLSVPGKVLSSVLLQHLHWTIDQLLREEQAKFWNGRSCSEHIFVLRTVIEQSAELQQ